MARRYSEHTANLPELVRDSKLQAKIEQGTIVHFFNDRPGRYRVAPREERWNTVEKLGSGVFGVVFKVRRSMDPEALRAIKEISIEVAERLDLYKNELVAFAKFSGLKVYSMLKKPCSCTRR